MLDGEYRPVWDPELPVQRPKHPERVQRFMYGLGRASAIIDGKMEDRKPFARRVAPPKGHLPDSEKGTIYGPRGEVLSTGGGD